MTNARRATAVSDDALGRDDVTALLHRLARREVSADELRTAAVARMEAINPLINAVVSPVSVPSGDAPGPFAGMPTVLKDNEDLQGYPTLHGSWAPADRPAAGTSPWVSQYLALGFDPIAKTTLPEFGLTASTETSRYGATRNPWGLDYSVGGSSGGSAALVASGVVPIAHGNDGGGSIRIPSGACGLVGLKPSRGRLIDVAELDKLPVNLVTQGVLTRSVRDVARYFAEAERLYRNPTLPPIGHVEQPDGKPLRIALLVTGLRGLPVDPQVRAAAEHAAHTAEGLGHVVEEITMPVPESFGPDFLRYWAFLAFTLQRTGSRLLGPGFDGRRSELFTKGLSSMFVREAERLPMSLRRLRRAARTPMSSAYDVMISPTLGQPTPPIGYLGPDVEFRTQLVRLLQFSSFTPLQNVSGEPAISLPLGRTDEGMPIGVQFAAPRGQESRLLSLAYQFEEATPWEVTPT